MNSLIAEFIELYSPPIPSPDIKIKTNKLQKFQEIEIKVVPKIKRAGVMTKSFFLPFLSLKIPKSKLPITDPVI